MADKDDDLLDSVSAMADRMGLTGRERSRYIHEHMTRSGFKAVPQYVKAEDDEDEDKGSGFFGGSSRRRPSRDDGSRSRRRRDDDDDDWYS